MNNRTAFAALLALAALGFSFQPAQAQEATIRKNIAARLPDFPKIDEVSKTPIPGLYELRIGTEVLYSDEQGNYVIEGNIIDTRARVNLTQARVNKLSAIDFDSLPLKDAMVWKQGNGSRKVAVFADPNCGYCKKFERDLQQIKDVTVYTFLIPILGGDSPEKATNIWCAKDSTRVWREWMIEGKTPPRSMGACETPIARNLALSRKHKINSTPSVIFEDGTRVPGAVGAEEFEKQLVASSAKR
ncbi:MAG: DsbC family protein [Rhizobacter sp.]|jgi:thiol:disulfide interchange protein DsbC|nr:DsbC family protein [Burkholderiaceae bacterium]MCO5124198.1 DsbC family protein [Rhizobacter sp.]